MRARFDAQVERRGIQQPLRDAHRLVARRARRRALPKPVGQVARAPHRAVASLRASDAPGEQLVVGQALERARRKAEHAAGAPRRPAARGSAQPAGRLERAPATQHRERRLGDERAVLLPEIAVRAEIAATAPGRRARRSAGARRAPPRRAPSSAALSSHWEMLVATCSNRCRPFRRPAGAPGCSRTAARARARRVSLSSLLRATFTARIRRPASSCARGPRACRCGARGPCRRRCCSSPSAPLPGQEAEREQERQAVLRIGRQRLDCPCLPLYCMVSVCAFQSNQARAVSRPERSSKNSRGRSTSCSMVPPAYAARAAEQRVEALALPGLGQLVVAARNIPAARRSRPSSSRCGSATNVISIRGGGSAAGAAPTPTLISSHDQLRIVSFNSRTTPFWMTSRSSRNQRTARG